MATAGARSVIDGPSSATVTRRRTGTVVSAGPPPPLVPVIVQSAKASPNEGGTITLPGPTTAGNAVLIVLASISGTAGVLTVTAPGFSFVSDFFSMDATSDTCIGLAHALAVPASSSAFTVSWTNGPPGADVTALEVTNLAALDDVGAPVTGTSATPAVPVLTPSKAGDLAVVVMNNGGQPTAGPIGWDNRVMDGSAHTFEWLSSIVIAGTSPPIGSYSGGSSGTYLTQGALFEAAT